MLQLPKERCLFTPPFSHFFVFADDSLQGLLVCKASTFFFLVPCCPCIVLFTIWVLFSAVSQVSKRESLELPDVLRRRSRRVNRCISGCNVRVRFSF